MEVTFLFVFLSRTKIYTNLWNKKSANYCLGFFQIPFLQNIIYSFKAINLIILFYFLKSSLNDITSFYHLTFEQDDFRNWMFVLDFNLKIAT